MQKCSDRLTLQHFVPQAHPCHIIRGIPLQFRLFPFLVSRIFALQNLQKGFPIHSKYPKVIFRFSVFRAFHCMDIRILLPQQDSGTGSSGTDAMPGKCPVFAVYGDDLPTGLFYRIAGRFICCLPHLWFFHNRSSGSHQFRPDQHRHQTQSFLIHPA